MGDAVTLSETLAACAAEGVAVTLDPSGRLRYRPAPSPAVLAALRVQRDEVVRHLASVSDGHTGVAPAAEYYDPERDAVRIEYEEGGAPVGVWIVPDRSAGATFEGEPAVRRCELDALLAGGDGALRRALVILRAFPGARVRRPRGRDGAVL